MDTPLKIATKYVGHAGNIRDLAAELRAYGEQCRRAGAEAMQRQCANLAPTNELAERIFALPLSSSAEAASATWVCGAIKSWEATGIDPSEDCRWPICGCDPDANDVIASLQENGLLPNPVAEAASPAAGWRPTHRHYKGGLYRKIADATWENHMLPVVVYQNDAGRVWVRPASEFYGELDGKVRFAPLPPSPSEEARAG